MDELTDIFGASEQSSNNNQNAVTDSAVLDIFGSSQNNAQDSFNIDSKSDEPNVISMDQLIEKNKTNTTKVVKKKDKILIVQLVLIVIWVLATVLVYYFGYDFFEPFINV